MPDSSIVYCMVHSESREDAEAVCDVINKVAEDLEALRSGRYVVIPTSREHAEALIKVSRAYFSEELKDIPQRGKTDNG